MGTKCLPVPVNTGIGTETIKSQNRGAGPLFFVFGIRTGKSLPRKSPVKLVQWPAGRRLGKDGPSEIICHEKDNMPSADISHIEGDQQVEPLKPRYKRLLCFTGDFRSTILSSELGHWHLRHKSQGSDSPGNHPQIGAMIPLNAAGPSKSRD